MLAALFSGLMLVGPIVVASPPVTVESLLGELADPHAIARFPDPPFRLLQSSSYDRATKVPSDANGWFANTDSGHFLRVDQRQGRTESVMLDAEGPGAVVRIWSPNPKGVLRAYIDGASTPAIEAPMAELLDGTTFFGDARRGFPLAGSRSRGWNLFVPIPFAKRCLITTDDGAGVYYQVNWRDYAETVPVMSWRDGDRAIAVRAGANAMLRTELPPTAAWAGKPTSLARGERTVVHEVTGRSGVVDEVGFHLLSTSNPADLSTVLVECTFDGVTTVSCPLGALLSFEGAGEFADARRSVRTRASEGVHSVSALVRWPMPFESSAQVAITNLGSRDVNVIAWAKVEPWTWDDRSMHFHATWRRDPALHTRPMRDFGFVSVNGSGVLAGDSLHVINPVDAWWGEGDEKIYVDGETFPSHIGTGTEDYYGYGWCCPELFVHPLHSQSVCDGHQEGTNFGRTILSRLRGLDAIPFERSLRFDMEVWHWVECDMAYAATTFVYARPGSTFEPTTDIAEVKRGRIDPPPVFTITGAIECESATIGTRSDGLPTERQRLSGVGTGAFSGGRHLWVKGRAPGDFVELSLPVPAGMAGPVRVVLYATKSWDYGIVQFAVNGAAAGDPVDLFSGERGKVVPSGPVDLGVHAPVDGAIALRATVVGGNERSEGSRSFFGLDAVVMTPAR